MKRKEGTTTKELARMLKEGFDRTVTKTEMTEGFNSVTKRLDRVEHTFKVLVDEIRLVRDDLHDIHTSLKSLVSIVAIHDKDIERLKGSCGVA